MIIATKHPVSILCLSSAVCDRNTIHYFIMQAFVCFSIRFSSFTFKQLPYFYKQSAVCKVYKVFTVPDPHPSSSSKTKRIANPTKITKSRMRGSRISFGANPYSKNLIPYYLTQK